MTDNRSSQCACIISTGPPLVAGPDIPITSLLSTVLPVSAVLIMLEISVVVIIQVCLRRRRRTLIFKSGRPESQKFDRIGNCARNVLGG